MEHCSLFKKNIINVVNFDLLTEIVFICQLEKYCFWRAYGVRPVLMSAGNRLSSMGISMTFLILSRRFSV